MSIVKTEQVIEVSDWDDLVTKTYGRPYSFQQQDGCKDRGHARFDAISNPEYVFDYEDETVPEIVNGDDMGVSFTAWLARDPEQPLIGEKDNGSFGLKLWWLRNFYPTAESIAHDLVKRGLLEAGKYTIIIDW